MRADKDELSFMETKCCSMGNDVGGRHDGRRDAMTDAVMGTQSEAELVSQSVTPVGLVFPFIRPSFRSLPPHESAQREERTIGRQAAAALFCSR